jgi:DNA-binding transcriptional LysR family regulator
MPPRAARFAPVAPTRLLCETGREPRRRHQPHRFSNHRTEGAVIDKLEFFIAIAREKSFSRAAEACRVTQPTLSSAMKQLEDSLGVLLINRSSRYHGLTAEGERVLEWAKRIVGDARAMRQDVQALKSGLSGHLKMAAVPTALSMAAALTTPFRSKNPNVVFTILSMSSIEILAALGNLEIDAGITYLDNEPLGHVRSIPLYVEQYRFMTSKGNALADRASVTWAEVCQIPLCLLTPDMQNRRIIDRLLASAGNTPAATLESNSMIALYAHVRTGQWASIMPEKLAEMLDLAEPMRAIPIVEPQAVHEIGLVVPRREPMTPLTAALAAEARALAATQQLSGQMSLRKKDIALS